MTEQKSDAPDESNKSAAPEKSDKSDNSEKKDSPPKPRPKWPWILAVVIILAFVVGVAVVLLRPHSDVSTEDAFVRADYASVAPRVGGQVIKVDVNDTQPVKAGQLLVELDPTDFQVALDQAKAQLAQDEALLNQTSVAIGQQPAAVIQANAQLTAANAAGVLALQNAARYTQLASTGAGSLEQRQQADAQLRQMNSQIASAKAGVSTARRQIMALKAQRQSAEARIAADLTAIRRAELNLSYTKIVAPIDGVVGQRSVQVGNFLAPGTSIMAVVPLNDIYVDANFLEVELRHMRPGQRALVHVYAYNIDLNGIVKGIAGSSDAAFSPVPPNNATGNFTKIVQRLPVRILVDPNQPLAKLLRVGMSIRATIDTNLHDVVEQQSRSELRVTQ